MASIEKMKLRVKDGLEELHEISPRRERFSEAEIALSAWQHDPRYNFFESIRGKRRETANRVRAMLGREPKGPSAPHWFVLPGVEGAISELSKGDEPIIVREATHPETGELIPDINAYLNPPTENGKRPQRRSLDARKHIGYRLAHLAPAVETAPTNGNGPDFTEEVINPVRMS